MQVQPVRRARTPRYPTADILSAHPELLTIVPERWRTNPMVLRVLSGVLGLTLAAAPRASAQQQAPASHVAPLFVHGEGRGSFGCVAVNPPVFLSEDEARQVITEEAKRAGIEFAPNALTIKDVDLPMTQTSWCPSERDDKAKADAAATKTQRGAVKLNGFDAKRNVAYELVTRKLYWDWQDKEQRCFSSVSSIDLTGAAKIVRDGLSKKTDTPCIAVFYEPIARRKMTSMVPPPNGEARWREENGQAYNEAKAEAGAQLRAQVRDFLAWLKAQGVI